MLRKFLLLKINRFPLKTVLICLCVLAGASVFGINLLFTYDEALEQVLMSIFCACILGICFSLGVLLINALIATVIPKYYDEIFKAILDLDEEDGEDEEYIENANNVIEFKKYKE